MKRFTFSMQRLLEAREAKETGLQMKLANKIRQVQMAAEEHNSLVKTRSREVSDMLASRKLSGAGWKVALLSSYIQFLDSEIERCVRRIAEKTSEQEAVRVELTAALKERKVMEKLSEKEKATWALESKRLEQSELDESAATGFLRKVHAV